MFKLKTRVYTCSDKSILCILNRVFRNCFCYVRPSTKHVYAHQLPPLHLENLLPPANSIATSPSSLKACQLYQFFPTHTFSSLIRGTKNPTLSVTTPTMKLWKNEEVLPSGQPLKTLRRSPSNPHICSASAFRCTVLQDVS